MTIGVRSHYPKGVTTMTINLATSKIVNSKGEILAANGRNILQNRNL